MSSRVVVVGAGLAGLAAAFRLARAGVDVRVLEKSDRIGGTIEPVRAGDVSVALPETLPTAAPHLAGLIAELDLGDEVRRTPLDEVGVCDGRRTVRRSLGVRAAMAANPLRSVRQRRLQNIVQWLGPDVDPAEPWRATRLDDRSAADFSRVYLGRRALRKLVEPLLAAHFGLDAEETSRQLWLALTSPVGDPELSLVRGIDTLVEALGSRVPVSTAAEVTGIRAGGSGVTLASGEEVEADAVVCTVSPLATRRLSGLALGVGEASALARLAMDARVGMVVRVEDTRMMPPVTWLPRETGGACSAVFVGEEGRWLVLRARARTARDTGLADAGLEAQLIESAARAIPGLATGYRDPSTFRRPDSISRFDVGHYRAVDTLLSETAKRTDALVFGGAWTAGPHAEAAVAAGSAAASRVLARLAAR